MKNKRTHTHFSTNAHARSPKTKKNQLDAIGCSDTPIVELWNKIDAMPDPEDIRLEAACVPIDVDAQVLSFSEDDESQEEGGGRRSEGKEARVALLPEVLGEVEEQEESTGMS